MIHFFSAPKFEAKQHVKVIARFIIIIIIIMLNPFKCVVLSQSSRFDICVSRCYISEHWNIGSSFYSQTHPDFIGLETRRDEL